MWKVYQKFDGAVMYGVNKGVHAWNWTTGKTKADLANSLLTVAPVLEGVGVMMINPVMGAVSAAMMLFISHYMQVRNKEQETLEEDALKKGLLLNPGNVYERFNEIVGPMYGAFSGVHSSMGEPNGLVIGVGHGVRASSCYVMRADYLPPGKNVVDRVKDKLTDLVRESEVGGLGAFGCFY